MYGLINLALEEQIRGTFGNEIWENIKKKCGIDADFFVGNEIYDDKITFKLAKLIAEELKIDIDTVYSNFGEWWVLHTVKEKYGHIIASNGKTLKEFILNLPILHNRILMHYPKVTPPIFKISDVTNNSLNIHYYSQRTGLQSFVKGTLLGLGKLFDTKITIKIIKNRAEGNDHEIFNIKM